MTQCIKRTQTGFTLIELLVVIGIVALLSTIAGPALESGVTEGRRTACLSDTLNMLTIGRAEAAARQQVVALCGSNNQATCNTDNWEDGWLLFIDDGAGGGVAEDRNRNGAEEILRISGPVCGDMEIRSTNFTDAGGIGFDVAGLSDDRGTLVICDGDDSTAASAVILNVSGQSRIATDDDNDGIVEQDDGTKVTCS